MSFFSKFDLLQGLIIILLALAFQAIVIYRQQHKRLVSGASIPARGIVFPEADPRNWDASLLDMVKFFFNYGFYKFGLEVDFFSLLYCEILNLMIYVRGSVCQ